MFARQGPPDNFVLLQGGTAQGQLQGQELYRFCAMSLRRSKQLGGGPREFKKSRRVRRAWFRVAQLEHSTQADWARVTSRSALSPSGRDQDLFAAWSRLWRRSPNLHTGLNPATPLAPRSTRSASGSTRGSSRQAGNDDARKPQTGVLGHQKIPFVSTATKSPSPPLAAILTVVDPSLVILKTHPELLLTKNSPQMEYLPRRRQPRPAWDWI